MHRAAFSQRSFYTEELLHREACTLRGFDTEKSFTQRSFYTQKLLHKQNLNTEELLQTEAGTRRNFHKQTFLQTETFTHRGRFTPKLLRKKLHTSFYAKKLLHAETFTQKLLHTEVFSKKTFAQRNFYTETCTHRRVYTAFTHRNFCTEKSLHPSFIMSCRIFHDHSVTFISSFSCSFGQLPPSFSFHFAWCSVRPRFVLAPSAAKQTKREPRNK